MPKGKKRLPRAYKNKEFPYFYPAGARVPQNVRNKYFRKLEKAMVG